MTAQLAIREAFDAPGEGPAGLAWDGETVWHADYRAGLIYGLDPQTGRPRRSLYCPGNLSGLAWDGRRLWQSLYDQEMVRAIDPATHDFDQTLILEGRGWLSGVAWDGRLLWLVAQQDGQLLAVDPATGRFGPSLAVPVVTGDIDFHDGHLWASVAEPMRFDPVLGRFDWLDGGPDFAILRIDPAGGGVAARFPVEHLYGGLCWVGETLWLAHPAGRKLYRAHLT